MLLIDMQAHGETPGDRITFGFRESFDVKYSIERAVENRISIRLGPIGKYLAPLLTWQIEPRLGISLEELSPLRKIGKLKTPVMILAGSNDLHTRVDESRLLFKEASEPKYFRLIDGTKHQNFHAYAGKEYERQVLVFFRKYLEQSNI